MHYLFFKNEIVEIKLVLFVDAIPLLQFYSDRINLQALMKSFCLLESFEKRRMYQLWLPSQNKHMGEEYLPILIDEVAIRGSVTSRMVYS